MNESARSLGDEILPQIKAELEDLPPIQQQIAKYILEHPQEVVRMSISHLAMESGAKSEASIVKFYRALGFSGYHDFKVSLATEIAGRNYYSSDQDMEINSDDDIPSIRKKIFSYSMHILEKNSESIDDSELIQAIDILDGAKRVIILGYGTSAAFGYDFFVKLSRLGRNCLFSADAHVNALVLAEPQDGDVVFAISYSGESRDLVLQCRQIKGMAKIIALTGESDSPLAEIADVCINVHSSETAYHTDAMVSRIVQTVILDILFTSLAVKGGDAALARLTRSRQGLSFLKF